MAKNTSSGGSFVKMGTYADAVAIIFEPKCVERDVPGKFGKRDILNADLTIFDRQAIEGGKPEIKKGALITETAFIREYEDEIGEQMIAKLMLKPNTNGGKDYWVPRGVDQAIFEKAEAYLEQRDAAFRAAMESDGPDWVEED